MKNYLKIAYRYVLPVATVSIPTIALALQQYTLLVPLPGIAGPQTTFSQWLPGAFQLTIGIAAGLAFVMISFGGILYATSDAVGKKSDGKKYITNAIIGLLFVIGAWVILNTINPEILNLKWTVPIPKTDMKLPTVVAGTPPTPEQRLADSQVRARLSGIAVNHANMCDAGQTTGCTNLNGLKEPVIQGLLSLKDDRFCACSGALTITGGTEEGHTSHSGGMAVDLSRSDALNKYILSSQVGKVDTKLGPAYRVALPNGRIAVFLDEQVGSDGSSDRHWHVSFN